MSQLLDHYCETFGLFSVTEVENFLLACQHDPEKAEMLRTVDFSPLKSMGVSVSDDFTMTRFLLNHPSLIPLMLSLNRHCLGHVKDIEMVLQLIKAEQYDLIHQLRQEGMLKVEMFSVISEEPVILSNLRQVETLHDLLPDEVHCDVAVRVLRAVNSWSLLKYQGDLRRVVKRTLTAYRALYQREKQFLRFRKSHFPGLHEFIPQDSPLEEFFLKNEDLLIELLTSGLYNVLYADHLFHLVRKLPDSVADALWKSKAGVHECLLNALVLHPTAEKHPKKAASGLLKLVSQKAPSLDLLRNPLWRIPDQVIEHLTPEKARDFLLMGSFLYNTLFVFDHQRALKKALPALYTEPDQMQLLPVCVQSYQDEDEFQLHAKTVEIIRWLSRHDALMSGLNRQVFQIIIQAPMSDSDKAEVLELLTDLARSCGYYCSGGAPKWEIHEHLKRHQRAIEVTFAFINREQAGVECRQHSSEVLP